MTMPRDAVAEVKRKADLVAVVGRTVALRRDGAHYVGACPLHPPPGDLKVFTDSGRWKCFACGAGGDAIDFVRRVERVSFPQAVARLASFLGMAVAEPQLTPEQKRRRADRAEVAPALAAAGAYWQGQLWGEAGEEARAFLLERGHTEEILRAGGVGFAPRDWHGLHGALTGRGISVGTGIRAGLLVDRGDPTKTYDRFRDRVMFPLIDVSGRVVGYGGRALHEAERGGPKYAVSPETAVHRRASAVFAGAEAEAAIQRERVAVLVEGYLDVLAAQRVGLPGAVAVGGWGLSDGHARLLRRWGASAVVLAVPAGPLSGSPVPGATALLRAGLEGRVYPLPSPARSPEELARGRPADLAGAVRSGEPLTEWLIEWAVAERCGGDLGRASAEARLQAVGELLPALLAAEGMLQNLWIKRICRRFDLGIGVLRAEMAKRER